MSDEQEKLELATLVNGQEASTEAEKVQVITPGDRFRLHDRKVGQDVGPQQMFADLVASCENIPEGERVVVNQYTGDIQDDERSRFLFFEDGKHRIDFVLVWTIPRAGRDQDKVKAREVFEKNLKAGGLMLEHDIQAGRFEQYTKIHAPWEVLTLYAETMKIRMPIKERPDDVESVNLWDELSRKLVKFLRPFELDPRKVPILPKRYTAVFDRNKEYLFKIPENKDLFFSHVTRSRIVDYILRRTKYTEGVRDVFGSAQSIDIRYTANLLHGINRLLANDTYLGAYPLHEGSWKPKSKPNIRKLLYNNWASWKAWYKIQPLQYIRLYFGEKIGLYFAWIGYYSYSLVPVSILGLLVFLYGVLTNASDVVSQQSCDENNTFTMCPLCNVRCGYWSYYQICWNIRATHMFDNGATVFFAICMSMWATVYLEFWKREEAGIRFVWDVASFEGEEEPPRPEYLTRLENSKHKRTHRTSGEEEPYYPFWRRQVPVYLTSTAIMFFLVLLAIAAIIGVVFYRISVLAAIYMVDDPVISHKKATLIVSISAALINLIVIFILSFVYQKVATFLTDWESHRTQSEYDNSLTIKLYVLQFINFYSSLFYIAFFKGRFVGTPASYKTFYHARQEECQGGSCLTELCIQLSIIFVGKQLAQNVMEVYIPRIRRLARRYLFKRKEEEIAHMKPWEKDFLLVELGPLGLFSEYLEMMIQFGFVTLFVAAFPLAPLFALFNNILELRGDANKFITQYRRSMTSRARTIGVWYDILHSISRLAIVTNALIIAFTSSFIQRLVYEVKHGSMDGYVNATLAYFEVADFRNGTEPHFTEVKEEFKNITYCRYPDYREPPWNYENKYKYSTEYWHVVAAQFIFVVVFENFIVLTTSLIAYLIPDMPRKLEEQMRREAVVSNAIILETELRRAKGLDDSFSKEEMADIRKRAIGAVDVYDTDEEKNLLRSAALKLVGKNDIGGNYEDEEEGDAKTTESKDGDKNAIFLSDNEHNDTRL